MESKISYDPLWEILKRKEIKKMGFAKSIGISNATLAKLGKNEHVTLTVIEKICEYLNCDIGDVVEYVPTKEGAIMEPDTVEIYKAFDQFYKTYKRYNRLE